jgi:hypothetical protein
MVAETQTLSQRLAEHRTALGRLRAEAFVDYAPEVAGVTLRPMTLATFNRLLAFESPFVCGGPVDFRAIAVFVWVHHPLFSQFAVRSKERALRAVWRALHPRAPHLNLFLRFAAQFPGWRWLRHWTRATAEERMAEAIMEIRRLVDEAMHDFPLPSDDARDLPPVTLQAQILNSMRRNLDMTYQETEDMPLKKLVQLVREDLYFRANGKTMALMSRQEASIIREHLQAREVALNNR